MNSFDFSSTPATVTVEAANSKHRQIDILPLAAEVAAVVREFLVGREFDANVWPGAWWRRASQMLARDLAEAGIQNTDNEGRIVDFHALRTTFITGFARAGVQPAMAQKLASHSDINLTLGVYTQLDMCELADAVSRLPQVNSVGEAASTFAANAQ